MRHEDLKFIEDYFPREKVKPPILEIGSRLVPNNLCQTLELRHLFNSTKYYGLDMEAGERVDIRGNAECLPFKSNSIGTLLCIGTLEHIKKFWLAAEEFHRVLKKNSYILLATVFAYPIHSPPDYWRFGPDGIKYLMEPFRESKVMGQGQLFNFEDGTTCGNSVPLGVYAIAKK